MEPDEQLALKAQQTLKIPVAGMLVRPITKEPVFVGSYVTQILIADSKIPSSL